MPEIKIWVDCDKFISLSDCTNKPCKGLRLCFIRWTTGSYIRSSKWMWAPWPGTRPLMAARLFQPLPAIINNAQAETITASSTTSCWESVGHSNLVAVRFMKWVSHWEINDFEMKRVRLERGWSWREAAMESSKCSARSAEESALRSHVTYSWLTSMSR